MVANHLIQATLNRGGYAEVARRLSERVGRRFTRQAIFKWLNGGKVPATRAIDFAAVVGLHVEDVRPDVFLKRGKGA